MRTGRLSASRSKVYSSRNSLLGAAEETIWWLATQWSS
jgi:hypothetical protein